MDDHGTRYHTACWVRRVATLTWTIATLVAFGVLAPHMALAQEIVGSTGPLEEVIRQATKEIVVLGYVVTVGEATLIVLGLATIVVMVWLARRRN